VLHHLPVIPDAHESTIRKMSVLGQPEHEARPYLKNNHTKRTGGVAQMIKDLYVKTKQKTCHLVAKRVE
jgi:hypothetical protein